MDASEWKHHLLDAIGRIDCTLLAADAGPFLEHQNEAGLLTPENVRSVLA